MTLLKSLIAVIFLIGWSGSAFADSSTTPESIEEAELSTELGTFDSEEMAMEEDAIEEEAEANLAALEQEAEKVVEEAELESKEKTEIVQEASQAFKNPEVALPSPQAVINGVSLKSGFRAFSFDCTMRQSADNKDNIVGIVRKGQNLWIDNHDEKWAIVYKTDGPAYVKKECL